MIKNAITNARKPRTWMSPKKWKAIGNLLFVLGPSIGALSIAEHHEWIGLTASLIGIAGKGITAFFVMEEVTQ